MRRYVIKIISTSEKIGIKIISTQLGNENRGLLQKKSPHLEIKKLRKNNYSEKHSTTTAVITTDMRDFPPLVTINRRLRQPGWFIPRVIQCSRCLKASHTHRSNNLTIHAEGNPTFEILKAGHTYRSNNLRVSFWGTQMQWLPHDQARQRLQQTQCE